MPILTLVYVGKKKLTQKEELKYKFVVLKDTISELYNEKIKNNF